MSGGRTPLVASTLLLLLFHLFLLPGVVPLFDVAGAQGGSRAGPMGTVTADRSAYRMETTIFVNATGSGGGGSTFWTLVIKDPGGVTMASDGAAAGPSYMGSTFYDIVPGDPQGTWTGELSATSAPTNPVASTSFKVDFDSPSGVSVLIDSGAPATNSRSVALDLTATDPVSGVADMLLGNDAAFTGSLWAAYNATPPWTLNDADGLRTVYLKVRDAAGNEAGPVSDNITLDRVLPTALSILIAEGNDFTGGRNVTLAVDAKDDRAGLARMAIAEVATTPLPFKPYATSAEFPLSAGDGVKTVKLWVLDAAGNQAGPVNDTITLDQSRPTNLTLTIAGGTDFTKATAKLPVAIGAKDALSGPLTMRISTDPNFTGAQLLDFAATAEIDLPVPAPDGTKVVFLQVTDAVGNSAGPATDTIVLDRTIPRSGMPALATTQTSASFTVSWSGTDMAGSEPGAIVGFDVEDQVQGSGTWTSWLKTTADVTSGTFTGSDATTYLFRVRARDAAGNVEPFRPAPDATTTIAVDPGVPVVIVDPIPAVVSGIVTITGNASDDQAVLSVEIAFDGGSWLPVDSFDQKAVSWSFTWSTDTVPAGNHTIRVRAFDGVVHSTVQTLVTQVLRVGSGLTVRISAETKSLESGQATPVLVTVSADGAPVAGVLVTLSATDGAFSPASGMTDARGTVTVSFTAPGGVTAQTSVTVTATAIAAGLRGQDQLALDVVPPNTLAVSVFLNASEVAPGGAVSVVAHVVLRGSPVQAAVLFQAPEGGLTVIAGTGDASGNLASVFTAGSDVTYRRFNITVTASLAGANDGRGSAAVIVAHPPPTCTVLSPAEGASDLRAVVEIRGTCSSGTMKVEYQVDGGAWTAASGTVTWRVDWNTTKLPNGQHAIAVRGSDGSRTGHEVVRQLSVSNPSGFTPLVFVTLPTEGSTVKGRVLIQGTAFHPANLPITTVFIRADARKPIEAAGGPSWSATWDSTVVADGEHTLRVWVTDGRNESAQQTVHVTVKNGARASGPGATALGLLAVVAIAGIGSAVAAYSLHRRRAVTAIVEDVFLVHKDGRLLAHETRRLKPEIDDQMMGGMLAALQDFVKHSFKVQGKKKVREVGEITFGEYRILLEHGKDVFLGAVSHEHASGALRERMQKAIKRIEAEFGGTLASWDGDTDKVAGCGEIVRKELFG